MAKKINELGNRYGKLVVIQQVESKNSSVQWLCKCDCGNTKVYTGSMLRSGKATSCGCARRKDYTGKKFGKLTAIKFVKFENKRSYWLFKCECGNELIFRIDAAVSGDKKHCGHCVSTNIINEVGNRYGLLVVESYNDTKNGCAYWNCKCDCGNHIVARGSTLRSGDISSCGCLVSRGEHRIQQYLEQNNINFVRQYSFPDLKSEKNYSLRYDFAVFQDNNLKFLIEYDGEQHYYDSGQSWGHSLQEVQKRDDLKTQYALDHNIFLLRIPYTQYDDIESILDETLRG